MQPTTIQTNKREQSAFLSVEWMDGWKHCQLERSGVARQRSNFRGVPPLPLRLFCSTQWNREWNIRGGCPKGDAVMLGFLLNDFIQKSHISEIKFQSSAISPLPPVRLTICTKTLRVVNHRWRVAAILQTAFWNCEQPTWENGVFQYHTHSCPTNHSSGMT